MKPGNVALASDGTVVQGEVTNPTALNDGRVNERWNERAKAPLHKPVTLIFPEVYELSSIRIKLSDGAQWQEYYQYTVEASSDGQTYEMLEDRTKGEWRGWQDIRFSPRPVKSIRLTGTEDHPNHTGIRIYEIEAYCSFGEKPPGLSASNQSVPQRTSDGDPHHDLHATPGPDTRPHIGQRKLRVHSQVPHGAVLILTFGKDSLRQKNGVVTEVVDQSSSGFVGSARMLW